MRCHGCKHMFPLPELRFVRDGLVPDTTIKRHRAYCKDCPTMTIDGKPPEEKSDAPF